MGGLGGRRKGRGVRGGDERDRLGGWVVGVLWFDTAPSASSGQDFGGRRDETGDRGCSRGCFELAMGHDRKAGFLGGPRNDRGGRGCSRGCSEVAMGHDRKARFLGGPRNDRGGSQYSLSGSSNQFEDRSFQVGLAE